MRLTEVHANVLMLGALPFFSAKILRGWSHAFGLRSKVRVTRYFNVD